MGCYDDLNHSDRTIVVDTDRGCRVRFVRIVDIAVEPEEP